MAVGTSRATATVLFTDLVGSTELRTRLGEEAADGLRRVHDRLLAHAVEAPARRAARLEGLGRPGRGVLRAVGAEAALVDPAARLPDRPGADLRRPGRPARTARSALEGGDRGGAAGHLPGRGTGSGQAPPGR